MKYIVSVKIELVNGSLIEYDVEASDEDYQKLHNNLKSAMMSQNVVYSTTYINPDNSLTMISGDKIVRVDIRRRPMS